MQVILRVARSIGRASGVAQACAAIADGDPFPHTIAN